VGWIKLAAVGVAALVFAGCGGSSDRDEVSRFVKDANRVQERSAPSFQRANRAYVSFSKGNLGPQNAQVQLAAAERAMRRTRDDLAALQAPPPAKELQRRLVALYDADAAFAHESTLLAKFVPASTTALKPLAATGRRLQRDLRAAKAPKAQIAALRRYRTGIGRVLTQLRPLHPPPLLLERHHAEVRRLTRVRLLAGRLVDALQAHDSQRVASLLLRFRKLNTQNSNGGLPADAITAYNRRYAGVRDALAAVERERTRLERTLK